MIEHHNFISCCDSSEKQIFFSFEVKILIGGAWENAAEEILLSSWRLFNLSKKKSPFCKGRYGSLPYSKATTSGPYETNLLLF